MEALCGVGSGRGGQRVQPRGLTNPGNLCFMNATLQVAFSNFATLLGGAQAL